MSQLMTECDVAITAGGSTMYELCACSIPMITYSVADNQLAGVKGFAQLGIAKYCGDIRTDDVQIWSNLYEALKVFQLNFEYRKEVALRMKELVDGQGTRRIADEIHNLRVSGISGIECTDDYGMNQ